jgi:hypothetical protein
MLTSIHDRLFRRWGRLLLHALRQCICSLPQRDRSRLSLALERLARTRKREMVPEFQFVSTAGGGMRLRRVTPSK